MKKVIDKISQGSFVKFYFTTVSQTNVVTNVSFDEFRDSDLPMDTVSDKDQELILAKLISTVPHKQNVDAYHRWCNQENPCFWDKALMLIGSGAMWCNSGLIVDKSMSANHE